MYCHIKYADCWGPLEESQKSIATEQSTNAASPTSSKTTIVPVNKILTINPDCYVHILLEYVRDVIGLNESANFDFCDEYGRLLKIYNLKECEYATKVMKHKWNYIIILFEKNESGKIIKIEPYIHKTSKAIVDLCARLVRNMNRGKSTRMQRKKSNDSGIVNDDAPSAAETEVDLRSLISATNGFQSKRKIY